MNQLNEEIAKLRAEIHKSITDQYESLSDLEFVACFCGKGVVDGIKMAKLYELIKERDCE